jgi:hypothetical protein
LWPHTDERRAPNRASVPLLLGFFSIKYGTKFKQFSFNQKGSKLFSVQAKGQKVTNFAKYDLYN